MRCRGCKGFEDRRRSLVVRRWQNLLALTSSTSRRKLFNLQSEICNQQSDVRRFMREIISTPDAPKAIGPYSQAVRANGLVFVSGQVAIDPATQQVIEGDVAIQTERVMKNLS